MADKKREKFVTNLFLGEYRRGTGKHYRVVGRPEEDKGLTGTYDFLCQEDNSKSSYLAIEEKSMHLFSINVRDNKVIGLLLEQVREKVAQKGIVGNKRYCFFPDFTSTPKKKDRDKYVEKFADLVERAILEHCQTGVRKSISLPAGDLDCLKSLRLISARESSCSSLDFPFHVHSNRSWNVPNDILNALLAVVVSGNSSLEIPKQEGAKTVLLVTDFLAFGDGQAFQEAMDSIPPELHECIDEAFVVSRSLSNDSCSLYRIK
ncbi:MAG: hypothetical protein AMJ91_01550 [candidate division Zixibacteria bacterium SM23_73_3]|nr:MAG: hypothetical protein AMJ91_01550 [candidate division Zixibacteria bacterium SM23_73_3]